MGLGTYIMDILAMHVFNDSDLQCFGSSKTFQNNLIKPPLDLITTAQIKLLSSPIHSTPPLFNQPKF